MSYVFVGGTFLGRRWIQGVRTSCAETNEGEEISARRCGGERIILRVGVRGVCRSL